MKPEAWAALKALQRSGRERPQLGRGAHIDQIRQSRGMALHYTERSRKPARKAREKGK